MNNPKKELHRYAKNGWRVHPLRGNGKKALLTGWPEKCTVDLNVIDGWVKKYRKANYGIVTGNISNIWVLDIDRKGDKDGLSVLKQEYPDFDLDKLNTPIAKTPTGGYHIYFKYPAFTTIANSTNVLPGVDVRSDRGYVVVPPSTGEIRLADGSFDYIDYEWMHGEGQDVSDAPDYLINLVTKRSTSYSAGVSQYSIKRNEALSNDASSLDGVSEGSRDDYIFRLIWGFKGKGICKQEALISALTAASNCTPPFDEDSVFEKVNRIFGDVDYSIFESKFTNSNDGNDNSVQVIDDFNGRYAVVSAGTKTMVLDEKKLLTSDSLNECLISFEDFKKFHMNKKIEIKDGSSKKKISSSMYWLEHDNRRQFEAIVFDPSSTHMKSNYNFWNGFPIEGIQGDSSIFWDFLKEVICSGDQESYVYLRKWIAHIFKKPYELSRTAIAIMGKQGTGKSTLPKVLSKLLYKQNYLEVSSVNRLLGQFNGNLANRVLVNANEATWGGDKSHAGELKAMITEPTMTIEMKGRDSFQYNNYARFIFTTNSSYPVNAESDDRRFIFLECSDSRKGDADYWNKINLWMSSSTSLEALMYDLENEDISEWNANNRPSSNVEKQLDVKYQSMPNINKFIYEWIKEHSVEKYNPSQIFHGGYVVIYSDFYDEYRCWVDKSGIQDRFTTKQALASTVVNKLLPIESKRSNGKTIWHLGPWSSIYEYYCKNVIYCDPKWGQDNECSKNKGTAVSDKLKLVMGKRKYREK